MGVFRMDWKFAIAILGLTGIIGVLLFAWWSCAFCFGDAVRAAYG